MTIFKEYLGVTIYLSKRLNLFDKDILFQRLKRTDLSK